MAGDIPRLSGIFHPIHLYPQLGAWELVGDARLGQKLRAEKLLLDATKQGENLSTCTTLLHSRINCVVTTLWQGNQGFRQVRELVKVTQLKAQQRQDLNSGLYEANKPGENL